MSDAGVSLGEDVARAIDVTQSRDADASSPTWARWREPPDPRRVQKRAGCKILLALKGFAQWSTFPLVRSTWPARRRASSPRHGSRARSSAARSTRTRRPTPRRDAPSSSRSPITRAQLARAVAAPSRADRARAASRAGMRVNHEHQEVEVALYDPAAPCSRLGTTRANITAGDLDGIDGLHFHTLCQNNSDALERARRGVRAKVRRVHPAHEVGQLRRRSPHHAARLRHRARWSRRHEFRAKWQ